MSFFFLEMQVVGGAHQDGMLFFCSADGVMEVKLKRRGFPFLVLGKCWVFDPGEE